MRKSQEGLQKPRMDVTLHLALAPSLPGLMSSLAWRSSAELLYGYICYQFCNCQFGPSFLLCKSATILGSAKEHTVVFVGPSEALTLSMPKGAAQLWFSFIFPEGCFSLGTKGWSFSNSSAKQKFLWENVNKHMSFYTQEKKEVQGFLFSFPCLTSSYSCCD